MINNSQEDSNLGGWDAKSVFGGSDQDAHEVGKNEAIKALGAMKISEEPKIEVEKSGTSTNDSVKVDYNTGRDEVAGVWGEISMDSLAANDIPNNNNIPKNANPVASITESVNIKHEIESPQRSGTQVEIIAPSAAPQVKAHPMPIFNKPIPVVPEPLSVIEPTVIDSIEANDSSIPTKSNDIFKDSIDMNSHRNHNTNVSSADSLAAAIPTNMDMPLQKTGFLNTAVRDMAKGALEAAGVPSNPPLNMNPNINNSNREQGLKPTPPNCSPSQAHSNGRSGRGKMSKFLTGDGGDIVLRNRRQGISNDNISSNGTDEMNVHDSLEASAPITQLDSVMDEESEEHQAAAVVQRHFRGLQGRKEAARVELEQERNRLREKDHRRADATATINGNSTNGRVKTKKLPNPPQKYETLNETKTESPPVMKAVKRPPVNPRSMSTLEMNERSGYRHQQQYEEKMDMDADSIISNTSKGRTSRLRKPRGGPDSGFDPMNGHAPCPPTGIAMDAYTDADEVEPGSYEYGHGDALIDHRSASGTHSYAAAEEDEHINWDEDSLIEVDDEAAAAALRGKASVLPERDIISKAHSHAQSNHLPSRYQSSIAVDPDWGDVNEGDDWGQAYPVGSPARMGLTDNYDPFIVATNLHSHSGKHDEISNNSPNAAPGIGVGSPIRPHNLMSTGNKAPGVAQLLAAASEAMPDHISPSKLRANAPTMWQPPLLGNREDTQEEEKRNALADAEKKLEEKRQELVAREEFLAQQQMALQQQQQQDRRQMVRIQEELQTKYQQNPSSNPNVQVWNDEEQSLIYDPSAGSGTPVSVHGEGHVRQRQQHQQQYTDAHPSYNEAYVPGRRMMKKGGGYQQQHAKKQQFESNQAASRHHQQQPQRYRQEDVLLRNEQGRGGRHGRGRDGRSHGTEGYAGDHQDQQVVELYDPFHEEEMQFEREAQQLQSQPQQQRGRGIGKGSNKQSGVSKSRSRSPRAKNRRQGRDHSGSPNRQAPVHPGGVVEQHRERRKIKKQVMDDSEEQALMREIAELDEQQKHLEDSPKRIKANADRLALQKERKENKDKDDADKKKRAKLAFGPGARDYRSDKDPLKARREKAKQDRIAARERRERKALGHGHGNPGQGRKAKGRGDYGGAENEPPNMRDKRVGNRVYEKAEPEDASQWEDEPSEYGYDSHDDGGYLKGFESKATKPNQRRAGRGYDDSDARSDQGYANRNNRGRRLTEETSSLPPLKQRHSKKPSSAGNSNQRLPPIEPQYAY